MVDEIICVYQDCPLCGDRGKKLKKIIFEEKLNVRKVSFASKEGKDLVYKAVFEHQIGTMPFFTDGKNFSTQLADLLSENREEPKKRIRKTRKIIKKKGENNGVDS